MYHWKILLLIIYRDVTRIVLLRITTWAFLPAIVLELKSHSCWFIGYSHALTHFKFFRLVLMSNRDNDYEL